MKKRWHKGDYKGTEKAAEEAMQWAKWSAIGVSAFVCSVFPQIIIVGKLQNH